MKYYLKTLSYLHIGSGNELETFDYVVIDSEKGKIFCRINEQIFSEFLEKNNLVKEYQNYSEKIYKELDETKENKKQNQKRKELGLDIFCNQKKKFGLLEDFLKETKKIQKILIKDNEDPKGNKVREQVRDALQKPYIPGSSIKGAFRTALFYHWLKNFAKEAEICDFLKDELEKLKKLKKEEIKDKIFAEDIECFAFNCKKEKQKRYDEKFDLMKLLTVSDGKVVASNPTDNLTLAKPHLFLISSEKQKQAIFMEAIKENTFIEFDIQFNVQFLFSIKNLIKEDSIIINKEKQWIGIETKCKQLFDLDINSLTKDNLEQKEKEVINSIIKKTQLFNEKQLEKHQQWKDKIPTNPQSKNNQQEFFKKDTVNFNFIPKDKHIMHIGRGTGFIGTTEFLYILEKESLKETFLEVMEKFEIGKAKNSKEKYMENAFPKSRLMYETQDKIVIKPLGWVEILTEQESQKSLNDVEQPKSYQPQYFKEKLKQGVIVDAQYIGKDLKNPKKKKFKLFIQEPGKEQECTLNYASDLEDNAYVRVTVKNVDKNGKVQSIEFKTLIK